MLLTSNNFCIVLSNATPGDYEELIEMDNIFYQTHHLKEWQRSMFKTDVAKSNSSVGYHQFKYLKIESK